MKKIINSILFMAVASMMIFSCSKNLDIPNTSNQFKTIVTSDTTIVDCFTPTGNVTIYTLNDTLTVAPGEELEITLIDLITNMQPFTLAFPIDVILADGTTQTLLKIDDLIALLEECGVEFDIEEDESDDDTDESDDDTDESDDDTDESDDDTDESDDDTGESDDDTDESDDDTDESDDDTDESDDDTDESDDDTDESDDDTDESDDDTDESDDDTDESDDDTDESDDDDGN